MSTLNTEEELDNPFAAVPDTQVGGTGNPFDDEVSDDLFGEGVEQTEEEEEESTEEAPITPDPKKPKPTPSEKKTKAETGNQIEAGKSILKYLAERKGIADDIDFTTIKTEDDIADLVEAIEEFDTNQALERVKSLDQNIGNIIDFLQAGGDKSKISDLLIEQKEILDLDVSTPEGAKGILKQYYKNVLGFDDAAIAKRINRFSENGSLQEEAEDVKPLYDKNIESRQEKLVQEAQQKAEKERVVLRNRQQDFVKLLQDNKVHKSVAQNYYQVAFGQRELQDGTKIGELDYKFQVMQRDPNHYLKLVEFMADPNLYDKRVLQNKTNIQVTEQHNKRINFNSNKTPEAEESSRENKPKFKF